MPRTAMKSNSLNVRLALRLCEPLSDPSFPPHSVHARYLSQFLSQGARMKNGFFRGHGLGNDYVVMIPKDLSFRLTPARIKAICDRNWGLGSDGILALVPSKKADFGLRIFNPDGSEAEKSGNGLRIFARYLHATGKTKKKRFTVETKGGLVTIALHVDRHGDASAVTVEMGRATFQPAALPCTLQTSELVEQPIDAAGQSLTFTGVSVGNPHCVIFKPVGQSWSREDLLGLGP